ncbi:DNA polymerase III subunit delta' [Alteromonas facilis]|uniref:DNA polymerase III subunit delta' n=1 Tax=Alteromonas facilis TaxID=2048004 RepID=UPI000C28A8C3|nr:DNA polymerase III subunit delta' [Alteromonas facilis]
MNLPWFKAILHQHALRAEEKRLHHGLLLSGAKDIGKHQYAKALGRSLLCKSLVNGEACGECQSCQLFEAGSHPDYYWLETDKSQIGVDLIRSAIQSLSQTAQLNHNKVLIIADADLLSESAANALLKTLEEPTQSTYLLLVTDQPNRLLPTILSRCEKCLLPTPAVEDSIEWLTHTLNGESSEHALTPALLKGYGNAPFAVLRSLRDKDSKAFDDFNVLVESLCSGRVDALSAAEEWHSTYQQVIAWAQRYLQDKIKRDGLTLDQARWDVLNQLNTLSETARHAGVNKVLLLVQTFTLLQEF